MAEFKEEAYVLEKMEISEDDDDGFEYKEILPDEDQITDVADSAALDEDDDLNDFEALKVKTEIKKQKEMKAKGAGISLETQIPKTIERDIVIDDFIRNFLTGFKMNKTLNTFQ